MIKIYFREEIIKCTSEQYEYLAQDVLNLESWKGKKINLPEKVKNYNMLLNILYGVTKLIKKLENKK